MTTVARQPRCSHIASNTANKLQTSCVWVWKCRVCVIITIITGQGSLQHKSTSCLHIKYKTIKICRRNLCRTGNLVVFERFNSICIFHVRWQTVPRSRSCNTKSTFAETETTAENEQIVSRCCRPNVRRLGGRELRQVAACQWCKTVQEAVESWDRLQHVSDVRRCKTV